MIDKYIANKTGLNKEKEKLQKLKEQVIEQEDNIKLLEQKIKDKSAFDISIIDWIKEKYSINYKIDYEIKIIKSHNSYIFLLVNNNINEELDYDNYVFWNYVENKEIIILGLTTIKTKDINLVNKMSFIPNNNKNTINYNRKDFRTMDEFETKLLTFINDLIAYKVEHDVELSTYDIEILYTKFSKKK